MHSIPAITWENSYHHLNTSASMHKHIHSATNKKPAIKDIFPTVVSFFRLYGFSYIVIGIFIASSLCALFELNSLIPYRFFAFIAISFFFTNFQRLNNETAMRKIIRLKLRDWDTKLAWMCFSFLFNVAKKEKRFIFHIVWFDHKTRLSYRYNERQ